VVHPAEDRGQVVELLAEGLPVLREPPVKPLIGLVLPAVQLVVEEVLGVPEAEQVPLGALGGRRRRRRETASQGGGQHEEGRQEEVDTGAAGGAGHESPRFRQESGGNRQGRARDGRRVSIPPRRARATVKNCCCSRGGGWYSAAGAGAPRRGLAGGRLSGGETVKDRTRLLWLVVGVALGGAGVALFL